jgi:AraC-like DNA-binding protein
VRVLEAFLHDRMLNRELDPRLSRGIEAVFESRGAIAVTQLAARAGATARTLGRLFERHVGLSPKRFARIVRVQAALRALPRQGTWTPLALELGYHDQAHFIHEVRALFGTTPRELVRLAPYTR